jgi:alpha-beta hydrolase superfamily lysophospholipase
MGGNKGLRYWRNLGCFLLALAGFTVGGLVVGVSWWQAEAFLYPRRHLPAETPADRGLDYRNVAFRATDGLTLRGWYLPSQNGAAVIVGHGIGGHRALEPAEMLARHGYGVLAFDWRAHGESDGDLCTFGYHEVRDVAGALAWLQQQPDVDPQRIGMLGESMGAVIAIRAASRLPELQAVVAQSPYVDLGEGARNVWRGTGLPAFPFVPLQIALGEWRTGLDLDDLQPLDDVTAISPRPILILAGGQDPITGPDAGQRYYAAAGEPKELWFEPELGHLAFSEVYPDEYERRVVGFFDAALGPRR